MDARLVVLYDDFCASKNCDSYIEWNLDDEADDYEFVYGPDCISCTMVGQSFNIDEYPEQCPYLEEIKEYEAVERLRLEKKFIWERMSESTI